ncbi:MAG TPA: penicillin-binding transpeptidase domain-containing protein, partial [Pyrinomonadaceae bacterium]
MMFLQSIPEKQPALLSLVYVAGFALVGLLLALSLVRNRRRRSALGSVAAADLPPEVRKRLGVTSTNRGLHAIRWIFVLLAVTIFGFHVYWAREAETQNEQFQALSYKDLRNRRLAESTLRGWILDRTGSLDRALAFYRRGERGEILREYPLDVEFAQIFGTDRGDAGLERALFGVESGDTPEAYDVLLERNIKQAANLDVRLTIDSELQRAAAEQLRGRHGAVVAINPQTGEILALYSNPSYSLKAAQDADTWIRLDTNKRDLPLVNRATRSYYIPGSTFKTVTMIAAYVAGMQDTRLTCSGSGYYAAQGAPPIFDDQGAAEVHGNISIDTAYEVSCNQYFAQLAVKLGPQKMEQAARLVGIGAMQTPEQARVARRQPEIMNASSESVAKAISPFQSTMVTGPKIKTFDLALEGYGQGYAGQMTPFQMALAAATIGNLEGKLM